MIAYTLWCGKVPVHPRKVADLRKTVKGIEVEWLPQTSCTFVDIQLLVWGVENYTLA